MSDQWRDVNTTTNDSSTAMGDRDRTGTSEDRTRTTQDGQSRDWANDSREGRQPAQVGSKDQAPESEDDSYTVKPGDTLQTIARALYGHESNWQALLDANADNDAFNDQDGNVDPGRTGFASSLEVAGTKLHTDLSRRVVTRRR